MKLSLLPLYSYYMQQVVSIIVDLPELKYSTVFRKNEYLLFVRVSC